MDKVHKEQAIKGGERGYFEAGTLVIDLINPQTSKLLKRAYLQAPILRECRWNSARRACRSWRTRR